MSIFKKLTTIKTERLVIRPYKLSDLLDRNTDRRCFIFTHLFFKDKAGNFKEVYPPGNWLGGEQYTRLNELNNKHKNKMYSKALDKRVRIIWRKKEKKEEK